jgi:hypothetical protein
MLPTRASCDLGCCVVGASVKMDADFEAFVDVEDEAHDVADELGRGETDGVGERDLSDSRVDEEIDGADDLVDVPHVAVRIAEGHGEIGDDVLSALVGDLADLLELVERFFGRLALVAIKELRRDGVREADGRDAAGVHGALGTLGVDDDADDLDLFGSVEVFEDELGVGHLRDGGFGDEAHRIQMLEACGDEGAEVLGLDLREHDLRQGLPGVAGTFDNFYELAQTIFFLYNILRI